jgi:hypothetical protein
MMPGVVARARAIVSILMLALCVATLALWPASYFVLAVDLHVAQRA